MRKRFEKEEMSLYLPSYKLRQLKHLRSTEIILEREKILFSNTCFCSFAFLFPIKEAIGTSLQELSRAAGGRTV